MLKITAAIFELTASCISKHELKYGCESQLQSQLQVHDSVFSLGAREDIASLVPYCSIGVGGGRYWGTAEGNF